MNALPDLISFVENVADLRFPPKADARIQDLMDRNTEGSLSPAEREELASLVSLSEQMSLFKARAFLLLGRRPA